MLPGHTTGVLDVIDVTKRRKMKGVDFVVDEEGEKKAVLIDLRRHGELWEDFYDTLLAQERKGEPRESLGEVKRVVYEISDRDRAVDVVIVRHRSEAYR